MRLVMRVVLATALVAATLGGVAPPASAAPAWSVVPSPTPAGAETNGSLSAVSCASATSCMAVSTYQYQAGLRTYGARWNGTRWSNVATRNSPVAGSTGSELVAVACATETFCVAVGSYTMGLGSGTSRTLVEHWNGASWNIVAGPNPPGATGVTLSGVSCSSPTSCIAVGQHQAGFSGPTALTARWNGTSWSVVANPAPMGSSNLSAVSCAAPDRCAAVGSTGATGSLRAFVMRWNGTKWLRSPVPPRAGATGSALTGVSCPTTIRCFAVGFSHNAQNTFRTLIYRWNGTAWATNSSPTPVGSPFVSLSGVSCASSTSCQAVGSSLTAGFLSRGLVLRWNGTTWAQATLAPPAPHVGGLSGVSCVSAGSCFAVGAHGGANTSRTWAVRWNGTMWSTIASPNPTRPGMSLLSSVSCAAVNDCMAVGDRYATDKPLAQRWNGTSWATVATPSPAGSDATLRDVSCATVTSCFAVGNALPAAGSAVVLEQWNGSSWTMLTTPDSPGTSEQLVGVSCATATSCFAVGDYQDTPLTVTPLVVRWDGTSWSFIASPIVHGGRLSSVSCSSSTSCFAVGSRYTDANRTLILKWDGASWSTVASPNRAGVEANDLVDVSCSSPTWCVAVGHTYVTLANGHFVWRPLVERWNGTSWAIASSPAPPGDEYPVLTGVSCASNTSCVAVGSSSPVFRCGCEEGRPTLGRVPLVERWNGTSWAIEPSPKPAGAVDAELSDVTCALGGPCVAVGAWQNGATTRPLVQRYQ